MYFTGILTIIIFLGWTGEFCDQPCENGTWGSHCEMVCHCSENALSCDPLTGECVCQPGARGKYVNYILNISELRHILIYYESWSDFDTGVLVVLYSVLYVRFGLILKLEILYTYSCL